MNNNLGKIGDHKSRTEKIYRQEVRKEKLLLRSEKISVSIMEDLVKGKPKIAELRYQKDIAESSYYTQISAIENKRLEIEVLRSKATWMRVEYQNG